MKLNSKECEPKNYAARLVDIIERLYIENMVLRALFKTHQSKLPPKSEVDEMIANAKSDPRIGGLIHEQFEPARVRIRENADLEEVLREFLRVLPPKKDVN
jgi:hypothetical protein